jgi:hypothetical protein
MQENYALVQRPAKYSWEALAILPATLQDALPVIMTFPRRCTVVSVYPSVAVQGGSPNLAFPTLDDILVRIDMNVGDERRLTSHFDQSTNAGGATLPNVSLGSFRDTVGGARVMNIEMPDGNPQWQIIFSWKRPIAGGPWFQDVFCGLTFHVNQ